MEVGGSIVVPVVERTQVGEARRRAAALCGQLGLGAAVAGRLAVAVTELATNLARHAHGGLIALRALPQSGTVTGVEILALDRGPGIADVRRCLVDGYSTAGSPGTGLGAVQRMSSSFDITSAPGLGTAVVARVGDRRPPDPVWAVGAIGVPASGEDVCGDSWAVRCDGPRASALLADGLGHGPEAAEPAARARRRLLSPPQPPRRTLERAHEALRDTRGAAIAVAVVDLVSSTLRFAGVGNVSAAIIGPDGRRNLLSSGGIVGRSMAGVREHEHEWPPGSLLLMHSDGCRVGAGLDSHPGLVRHDPGLVAGIVYRDFARGRDDATVLVVREARAIPSAPADAEGERARPRGAHPGRDRSPAGPRPVA